jgi:hypothetical protein
MKTLKGSRCYVRLDFVRQFKSKKRRPSKVAMFDSDLVRLIRPEFDLKIESNKTLIELNLAFDLVRLILISTNLT